MRPLHTPLSFHSSPPVVTRATMHARLMPAMGQTRPRPLTSQRSGIGIGARVASPRPHTHSPRAAAAPAAATSTSSTAKADLFDALTSTRGARVSLSRSTRGALEEAISALEALSPDAHDWRALLPGRWLLAFTTAADVAPFLALSDAIPSALAPLLPSAGAIYQEFDPPDADLGPDGPIEGEVRNVIRAGVPPLLRSGDGLTATVRARYEARSGKRLRLQFQSAGVGGARLSGLGEVLLAPAALPGRGWLQQRAVLAVAEAGFTVPLRRALPKALQPVRDALEREAGSEYLITYLDADTLIGRQTGTGGLFVLTREE